MKSRKEITHVAHANGAFAETERWKVRMPATSGRMEFLIAFKMAPASRWFRYGFCHIFKEREREKKKLIELN